MAADRDLVGGHDDRGPVLLVERDAGAQRLDAHGRGPGLVDEDRPAVGPLAEHELQRQARQGHGGAGAEVDRAQVGVGADDGIGAHGDLEADRRRQPRVAIGPRDGAHAERHRRDAERQRDLVADHRAVDERGELAEPGRARGRVADHVLEPDRERVHAGGRELLEGQRGHRGPVAQAEEAGQRRQRPGGQPGGLSADQSEDEVEGRVVELVEGVGPDREVPRRARARHLQSPERQSERRVRSARPGRYAHLEPDRAQVCRARDRGAGVDGDLRGEAHDPVACAQQQRVESAGRPVLLARAEQRDVQRRLRLGVGGRHAHPDADADVRRPAARQGRSRR